MTSRLGPIRRAGSMVVALTGALVITAAGPALVAHAAPATSMDTPSPICTARTAPYPQGPATEVSDSVVAGTGARLHDVVLNSPALAGTTHVYVLMPKGFDVSGVTRYPVLYLLHGAAGSYSDWVINGHAQAAIDSVPGIRPFITIMPDAGAWGFYNDWYGSDLDGTPNPAPGWTTYHVQELIPWVDAHYPTIAARNGRAIAGLSMGGYGTMSYAARFPELFAAAGSFSGALDPDMNYPEGDLLLNALAPAFSGQLDQCVWGDEVTQDVRWRGGNPTYIAASLAHTTLYVASGGGQNTVGGDPIEQGVYGMSQDFVKALDDLGIPHTDNFYAFGTHSWPYWEADLKAFLPIMAKSWAAPPAVPPAVPFSYRSIEPVFSVWGWTITTDHLVTEFTYLSHVTPTGFEVRGSGTLHVVSPPLYAVGRSYNVTVAGVSQTVTADGTGRLTFQVGLGNQHTTEQTGFTPNTQVTGAGSDASSTWTDDVVTIAEQPVAAVPEAPAAVVLLGAGALIGALASEWRRRRGHRR